MLKRCPRLPPIDVLLRSPAMAVSNFMSFLILISDKTRFSLWLLAQCIYRIILHYRLFVRTSFLCSCHKGEPSGRANRPGSISRKHCYSFSKIMNHNPGQARPCCHCQWLIGISPPLGATASQLRCQGRALKTKQRSADPRCCRDTYLDGRSHVIQLQRGGSKTPVVTAPFAGNAQCRERSRGAVKTHEASCFSAHCRYMIYMLRHLR